MKKLSQREKTIFLMTSGLTVVFIILNLIVKPLSDISGDIDEKIRLTKGHLNKTYQMIAASKGVGQRYKHWVDLFGLTQSEGKLMAIMVSSIELAAWESNVHIANIQPQATRGQQGIQFLPVELEIDGAWLDIVKFMYTLQQAPNYYFIDELNLEKYSETINALRGRIILSSMRFTTS